MRFKMENIEIYLKAAALYGVANTGIFPTVDLYENRNLGAVIAGLQSLGSEVDKTLYVCVVFRGYSFVIVIN